MKNLIKEKISEKNRKIAFEVVKILSLLVGLSLIFMCCDDGKFNGRFLAGLFLFFVYIKIKISEEK